jgi:TIR domain
MSETAQTATGIRIFVGYRRSDTAKIAQKIYGRLSRHFGGTKAVFQDVNGIRPGRPWSQVIDEAIATCHVFVVLIGSGWLAATKDEERRRIDDSEDRHRREIEVALEREIPVIPVLIDAAEMPAREDLPESLRPLYEIQAQHVYSDSLDADMMDLIDIIEEAWRQDIRRHPIRPRTRRRPVRPRTPAPLVPAAPTGRAVRGDFDAAEALIGVSGTATRDNTGARKEEDEPNHAGNAGGRSVWYRWSAPIEGMAIIDTFGSDFDTLLAVYRGSRIADLELVGWNVNAAGGRQSRMSFTAIEGEEYKIAVDGYDGESGAIVLNWVVRPAPANDDFDTPPPPSPLLLLPPPPPPPPPYPSPPLPPPPPSPPRPVA